MVKFTVQAYAVDWCGYESTYEIEAESEEEAIAQGCQNLIDEYDLMLYEDGQYGETDDFDEDGMALDDVELTSVSARILEDE